VRVTAPGKGRLTVSAKGARTASRTLKRAGGLTLTLRVKGHAKAVRVAVSFRPAGGAIQRAAVTAKIGR
jgi:hypothetical protein